MSSVNMSKEEIRKEKRRIYNKEYRAKNKEKIAKRAAEKSTCERCGALYTRNHKQQHEKSEFHKWYGYVPWSRAQCSDSVIKILKEIHYKFKEEYDEIPDNKAEHIKKLNIFTTY
jgi:hypothetical protein